MQWIYNVGIFIFEVSLNIVGLFNPRINAWNRQRKYDCDNIAQLINNPGKKPIIWMHCASLGEFEQGVIVIKKLQERSPEKYFYLFSFFSPSGYLQKKNNQVSDAVFYLPLDRMSNMERLVSAIQPHTFIGVKYEFWWNLLSALSSRSCRIIYISVLLRKDHYIFNYFAKRFSNQLQNVNHIFTQDKATYDLLEDNNFKNIHVSSDTRIASVAERKSRVQPIDELAFLSKLDRPIIVYGSIYLSDLPVLTTLINDPSSYHVIVPHHIDKENISAIQRKLSIELGLFTDVSLADQNIYRNGIIIDTIGKLFDLYQYASFVYIGGGFEKGIHNTLEPAVFNVPLAFGPKYQKFPEAHYFIDKGSAISVSSHSELTNYINSIITDPDAIENVKKINGVLFKEDKTVDKIIDCFD